MTKLPNTKGLWPDVMKRLAAYDPGNKYAVNYMWFTTGIALTRKRSSSVAGNRAVDSWDIIFKPENLRRVADCGVYVRTVPRTCSPSRFVIWASTLIEASGRPAKAAGLLGQLRANVRKFHSSEYINALANGDIAGGWLGGGFFQALNRAKEAKNGIDISYVIPKEGTLMSLDNFAIPKDAPQSPKLTRSSTSCCGPKSQRATATSPISPMAFSVRSRWSTGHRRNPAIYPDPATMARLFTVSPYDAATQRLVTREWTRVKTGK